MMPTRDDIEAWQIDHADEVNRIRNLVECVGIAVGNEIIDHTIRAPLSVFLDVICHDLRKLSDDMVGKLRDDLAGKSDGSKD